MKKLVITLLLSTSLSTFADYQLDFTLSDFCFQDPKVQYRNGSYFLPNHGKGISETSICVFKNAYGQFRSKGKLKNGNFDGKWNRWSENGQMMSEWNYRDGMKNGKWTEWYSNGQIWSERNWKDDMRVGKWSEWYEYGQIESESYFYNDERNDKWNEWHENGQRRKLIKYDNGKLIFLTHFDKNGNITLDP